MSAAGPSPIAPVPEPDLRSLLSAVKGEVLSLLNCHEWGVVRTFDPALQTATVAIAALRQTVDNSANPPVFIARPYPTLLDVPVCILSGGTGALTFPIAAGDVCLVLFNDRDFDKFWETGSVVLPNSARLHDLSDGLAIVGFRTKASPLAAYDSTRVKLFKGTTLLTLGDKIGLANASTSLKTVLSDLITKLKTAKDTDGTPWDAGTLTDLDGIQTEINNLLE